jgi:pimeloyl-ACP methyl ester carboxylesterase
MTARSKAGPRAVLVLALAVGLVASACTRGSGDGEGAGTAEPAPTSVGAGDGETSTSTALLEPTFVEGDCGFEVPVGTRPRCGTVTVPMSWETGEGQVILPVAVFESTASDPAPDPVVYLEGGPGGHALETIRFVTADLLQPLQDRGDVVFFDQRGVGLSEPRLDCEEVTALQRELENQADVDRDEAETRTFEALRECSERLSGLGVDLGQYHSINNAHDVDAIRRALGYDQWNLYGISYGTKLGLEVMRQHPEGVRTAVLDSVFPPQVDSTRDNPSTFVASYEAVVAACEQEPACAATGDLEAELRRLAQSLDADPLLVDVVDPLTGESAEIYVDGDGLVELVTQALYSPLWFTDLPELVAELEAGETGALEQFLGQQRANEAFFTDGMFYAIECNEEVAFSDPAAVAEAVPADPFGLLDTFEYASNVGTLAFGTCDAFGSVTAPPESDEAVASDIPTLLMAGSFDPVTPVSWAEATADTLPNSHVVVAPAEAHGVSPGRCGMSVVRQFLDAPDARPDASCFDESEIRFLGPPSDDDIVLEAVELEQLTGVTLSTVRPQDWVHGDLPGDSYRRASFLDATQIVQVAGDEALSFSLEIYVQQTWGVSLSERTDPSELFGRDWRHRQGSAGATAVEWYETEIGGFATFVVLVSSPSELDHQVDAVLEPALESIDVRGS